MKKRKLKVAIIYWLDAVGGPEHKPDEAGAMQASAGLLVSKNRHRVQIAQIADVSGDAEPWRDVLTIPAPMIKAIMTFDVPDALAPRPTPSG